MKRRYIVCFDGITKEQSIKVKDFFESNELGWWHWIGDTWFVTDRKGKFSAKKIRDEIKFIVENQRVVVIEMNENGDTWAGIRADDPDEKMFLWFINTWNKIRDS